MLALSSIHYRLIKECVELTQLFFTSFSIQLNSLFKNEI